MPPKPTRIAQTSNEVKKQFKQNGPRLSEYQQKQLERGHELDTRAQRLREAEERRKAAKKKRDEREQKEAAARKQTGVGLATQLIGYSHTQAQLKNGMEAFLGLKKRNDAAQRKKEEDMAKKLEELAQKLDKEPWDDDDEEEDDELALDLPQMKVSLGEQYADDDLDDDALREAHDLVMSDPIEVPPSDPQSPRVPFPPTIAPPPAPAKEDADFTRLHGPINKAVESILDKLPEPLIELLSQDMSMKLPAWDPSPGLLHKLNPLGLPPHRLRIKVGSIVSVLRDLDTSSQLSKSQHLRVLRVESHRLECLVLDGQLEGTKTFLTRIAFHAKYRNDEAYPFQRLQFPIRIAAYYTPSLVLRAPSKIGFKLPLVPALPKPPSLPKGSTSTPGARPTPNQHSGFRMPGSPASKSAPLLHISPPSAPSKTCALDGWDDFLGSGTQIARELSSEPLPAPKLPPLVKAAPSIAQSLPPLSTQDFDFSMDDLVDIDEPIRSKAPIANTSAALVRPKPATFHAKPATATLPPQKPQQNDIRPKEQRIQSAKDYVLRTTTPSKTWSKKPKATAPPIDLSTLTPSQMPRSVPDHHPKMFKRKPHSPPTARSLPSVKKPCVPAARSAAVPKTLVKKSSFDDFALSTQEVVSFFDDDADLFGGSPPITV